MNKSPLLSIVTPTLGKFSDFWLESLLKVEGNVEFVLVYPPSIQPTIINDNDPRIKTLTAPYKGEMMQRYVGLLNAKGKYVLALDDDDFIHPHVCQLTETYFAKFPDSWILRLNKASISEKDQEKIKSPWIKIPDINQLKVCEKYENGNFQGLFEIPIAPLTKKFDLRYIFFPFFERKDNHGYHFENFNNIVWKNEIVQKALPKLSETTKVLGAITWISSTGADRLMGLFVQGNLFEQNINIGHWLPKPEQIRYIGRDNALKPPRFHVISDFLLLKGFPQYGYFWNLFFSKLYGTPRAIGKSIKMGLTRAKN